MGLFGYIVGELAANMLMPIIVLYLSWTAAFTFVAATSIIAAGLYLSVSRQEKATVTA